MRRPRFFSEQVPSPFRQVVRSPLSVLRSHANLFQVLLNLDTRKRRVSARLAESNPSSMTIAALTVSSQPYLRLVWLSAKPRSTRHLRCAADQFSSERYNWQIRMVAGLRNESAFCFNHFPRPCNHPNLKPVNMRDAFPRIPQNLSGDRP
jgi:hypothetical protein